MAFALLAVFLGTLWWFVRRDRGQYQEFKSFISSADRQRRYRYWILKSFVTFSGLTVAGMALLGRLDAFARMPAEFAPLAAILREELVGAGAEFANAAILGLLAGAGTCLVVAALVQRFITWRYGKVAKAKPPTLLKWFTAGDIEALIPRNRQEALSVAVLSINAGFSEELFFRLALPLLLATTTGSPALAFAAATLIFGAVHCYQGWVGVAATTVAGAMFAAVYLASGDIWLAVLLHALMDLVGLLSRACLRSALNTASLEPPAVRP